MADDHTRLIAEALGGGLDDVGRSRLADLLESDALARAEFAQQACWDQWIQATRPKRVDVDAIMRALPVRGHVASAVMRRTAQPRRAPTRGVPLMVAALVMAVMLIAVGSSLMATRQAPVAPRDDRVIDRGGEVRSAERVGDASSDVLVVTERVGEVRGDAASGFTVGADGRLGLIARDGTKLEVRGPAALRVHAGDEASDATLIVASGDIGVVSTAAATERSLTLLTPTARLTTVVASRYDATVDADATTIAVVAGRVRFRSMLEEREILAGDAVVAPARIRVLAAEDGTAAEDQPEGLSGKEPELTLHAHPPQRMACLRFRLPAQGVDSAVLELTRLHGDGAIAVHLTESTWDESTLRWWHVPQRGRAVGAVVADRTGLARVDVTAACAGGVCDISLWGAEETDCAFASREAAVGAPMLEITLLPMTPIGTP